jgi:Ig-like domain CHU_C associated/Secretion system C-terminal sorting domain
VSLITTQGGFWGISWGNAYNTTVNNNNINTISKNAAGYIYGLYGPGYNKTVTGNTIYGLSSPGAQIGINVDAGTVTATTSTTLVKNNSVYNFSGAGTKQGIICSGIDLTGVTIDVSENKVYNFTGTGPLSGVRGILVSGLNAEASNIYKNKVHSLQGNSVLGISNNNSRTNTYNNYIGFTHPTTSGVLITGLSVSGPNISAVTPADSYAVYNNTIYINAVTSSAANFSSIGITGLSQKSDGLLLQNNFVMNRGVPKGIGKAIAFYWANGFYPISNISTASNNNSFYAGSPDATHLIYSSEDPDNSSANVNNQTLAAYQTYMAPRESNTISESNYVLLSSPNDGTQPDYLHIPAGNITRLESGGTTVALFNTDYDGDNRPGPTGSIHGGGTAYDIGADEFDCVKPTCTTPTPGNTLSSAAAVCYGGSATLSLQNSLAGTGYVYQWASSPDGILYNSIAGANAATYNAANITTDGYFKCFITCYNSPSTSASSVAVRITIHKITGTTPGSRCGTGTVVLGAAGATGTINWYSSLTGGSSLGTGTSFTTPSISTTTSYYVDITNTTLGCTSGPRVQVIATVTPLPTITSTTPGSRCGTGGVTLSATSSAGAFGTPQWYTASTGGTWVGSGTSFTTPIISTTTTYYVETTNMMGCTSPRTAVTATVYNPSITGTTPASSCNPGGPMTLSATSSTGSIIKWYAAATGGTPLFTGPSYVIPSLGSTTTYYVEASESTCASARTAVVATINVPVTPSVSIASGSGSTICAGSSVTFTATPVNGGSAPMYNFRKNGVSVQNSSSATYTTGSLVNGDVITCIITANNPCQTTATALSNAIIMTVSSNVTPGVSIAANPASGIICGTGSSVTITATPVNGGGSPLYNFKVNGTSVQNGASNIFTSATLANNDVITCTLTANNTCQTTATANSNSITITYGPPVPGVDGYTIINTANDIEIANAECTGADGWTTYYNTINKKIILSVKKNGNNIGSIGDAGFVVESGTTPNYGSNTATAITAPYVTQSNWFVMNRYWKVTTNSQPLSNVNIRTYYTTQDIADVQGSVPTAVETTVYFFKINGGGDPNPVNGHTGVAAASAYNTTGYWEYSNGVAPGTNKWEVGSVTGGRYAEYTIASFSGGGGGASPAGGAIGSTLPLRLISFTGQKNSNGNLLQWKTADEVNTKEFVVERSSDGRSFTGIATIDANGSGSGSYDYNDNYTPQGKVYYRLKMKDIDDHYTYSTIVVLSNRAGTSVSIYPNPASNIVTLSISNTKLLGTTAILTDVQGKTVKQQIEIAGLPAGMYFIKLADGSSYKLVRE